MYMAGPVPLSVAWGCGCFEERSVTPALLIHSAANVPKHKGCCQLPPQRYGIFRTQMHPWPIRSALENQRAIIHLGD
jgi:hypothetical protein